MRLSLSMILVFGVLGTMNVVAKESVLDVWAEIDAHWNARDADGFSERFTEDARFVFVDRRHELHARDGIHAHFSEQFPQIAAPFSHHTTITAIREIVPGVTEVDGKVEIMRTSDDGAEPMRTRLFAIHGIMTRAEEVWRVDSLRVFELVD